MNSKPTWISKNKVYVYGHLKKNSNTSYVYRKLICKVLPNMTL